MAVAAMLLRLAAGAGLAQDTGAVCFEVIPARPNIEPPVPILIDKCSGRSWVLIRNGKSYRWSLIATRIRKGEDRGSRPERRFGRARQRIAEMLHLQQPEILRMKAIRLASLLLAGRRMSNPLP